MSIGWDIMELTLELDALIGQEIDLITRNAIRGKRIEAFIEKDCYMSKKRNLSTWLF